MSIASSACSFEIGTQNKIQLLPATDFRAVDGRPANLSAWKINKSIASSIIAKANSIKNPFVVDYDHASLDAKTNGIQAPAAGFFKNLHWIDGVGLFAFVEWTAKAAAFIRAGEYKFISPVLNYHPTTGEVISIINAAITNSPAIDAMMPVTALNRQIGGRDVVALTTVEKSVCYSMRLTEEQFMETKLKMG